MMLHGQECSDDCGSVSSTLTVECTKEPQQHLLKEASRVHFNLQANQAYDDNGNADAAATWYRKADYRRFKHELNQTCQQVTELKKRSRQPSSQQPAAAVVTVDALLQRLYRACVAVARKRSGSMDEEEELTASLLAESEREQLEQCYEEDPSLAGLYKFTIQNNYTRNLPKRRREFVHDICHLLLEAEEEATMDMEQVQESIRFRAQEQSLAACLFATEIASASGTALELDEALY